MFDTHPWVRLGEGIFPANVTAKDNSNPLGEWRYAWTEEAFLPATGVYSAASPARQGTVTINYATELSGQEITVPSLVWMRLKGNVGQQQVYEFVASASSGATTIIGTTLYPPQTPAQITTNVNDYAPPSNTTIIRISTDAPRTITGIATVPDRFTIWPNFGTSTVTFTDEDTASGALNRIRNPGGVPITLDPDDAVIYWDDPTTGRQRLISTTTTIERPTYPAQLTTNTNNLPVTAQTTSTDLDLSTDLTLTGFKNPTRPPTKPHTLRNISTSNLTLSSRSGSSDVPFEIPGDDPTTSSLRLMPGEQLTTTLDKATSRERMLHTTGRIARPQNLTISTDQNPVPRKPGREMIRFATTGTPNLRSMKAGLNGEPVFMVNQGPGKPVLRNNDGLAAIGEAFATSTGADWNMDIGKIVKLVYDATTAAWLAQIPDPSTQNVGGSKSTFDTVAYDNTTGLSVSLSGTTATVVALPATASQEGVVSTTTQTFAGNKTFNNGPIFSGSGSGTGVDLRWVDGTSPLVTGNPKCWQQQFFDGSTHVATTEISYDETNKITRFLLEPPTTASWVARYCVSNASGAVYEGATGTGGGGDTVTGGIITTLGTAPAAALVVGTTAVSGAALNRLLYTDGSTLQSIAAPTSGQTLIGGSTPAFQTISGSGATITMSAAGVITISAIANASLANSSITIGGTVTALGGSVLGNVTNDVQTKASIVPNTAPAAGKILVGNAGGTAYAPVAVSGSGGTVTLGSTGVVTLSAIANASLSNSSVTVTAGTALTGGGSVALGSSITLNFSPSADVTFNTHKITSLATGTADTDAVNVGQMNLALAALAPKNDAKAATVAPLAAYTYANGSSGVGATITLTVAAVLVLDGYTPALNDRLLIKNETGGNAPYNGLYYLSQVGVLGVTQAVLTRTLDFDQPGDGINGALVAVLNGTVNATTLWLSSASGSITFGTTNITWVQFTGTTYSADESTLHLAGTTFSILTAGVNTSQIAAGAVTLAKMANMATSSLIYRKTAGSGAPEVNTLTTLKTDLALTSSDVGLGNVTNDVQTKAAIVPNTAPGSGQLLVGGTLGAYVARTLNGVNCSALIDASGNFTLSFVTNAALTNSSVTVDGHTLPLGGSLNLLPSAPPPVADPARTDRPSSLANLLASGYLPTAALHAARGYL